MLKLHLGCGDVSIPGFINIDSRQTEAAERVEDIGTLPTIPAGTVELIYASHCLDHFSRWDYPRVLKRWHELLAPDGILRLSVVDFGVIVSLYQSGTPVSELVGLLHARQDYESNVRKVSWDYASLETDLFNAGFGVVRRWEPTETGHGTIQDCSQARWPRGDSTGRLVSLNVEAVKGPITSRETL